MGAAMPLPSVVASDCVITPHGGEAYGLGDGDGDGKVQLEVVVQFNSVPELLTQHFWKNVQHLPSTHD
jgi:hypothetical protein